MEEITFLYLDCVCVCSQSVCYRTCAEIREKELSGVGPLPSSCGFQELNLGYLSRSQVLLPTEPPHQSERITSNIL